MSDGQLKRALELLLELISAIDAKQSDDEISDLFFECRCAIGKLPGDA